MANKIKRILHRIYSDFLLPSRLKEFEAIITSAKEAGYQHQTLSAHLLSIQENRQPDKVFIHRHDIDTDIKTARRFFEIEQKHGVKTSYYFRLSTIDIPLMQEIHASGSEVGYHFEEIAQYAKDFNLHGWEQVKNHLPAIRKRFEANFKALEKKLGFKTYSVVSHGDFVNRILGHQNNELLTDELRARLGIDLEGYDAELVDSYQYIQSDKPYPLMYRTKETPFHAIAKDYQVIYLLTHPRHWHCAPWINLKDNWGRLKEGLAYKKSRK